MTTKKEVLRLAAEAGFDVKRTGGYSKIWAENQCRFDGNCPAEVTDELTCFAELVAQHEREACEHNLVKVIRFLECQKTWNGQGFTWHPQPPERILKMLKMYEPIPEPDPTK